MHLLDALFVLDSPSASSASPDAVPVQRAYGDEARGVLQRLGRALEQGAQVLAFQRAPHLVLLAPRYYRAATPALRHQPRQQGN